MTALFCAMFLGGITVGLAGTVGVVVDVLIFLVLCGVVSFICMTLPHAVCARLRVEQVFKFYWTVVGRSGCPEPGYGLGRSVRGGS